MRWLAAVALALMAAAAAAQPATVTVRSGEHAGFTRLALLLPAPGNWRFGRTPTGYELRLDRAGILFDLSGVFAFIRRDRLASLWSDPATGALVLGIGCACHAVAYAAQPTVIVIDIRDGAAAAGSGFETAIGDPSGLTLPALSGRPVLRPRARPAEIEAPAAPYDWRSAAAAPPAPAKAFDPTSLPGVRLREAIARQIGAASVRGLVDAAVRLPAAVAPDAAPDAPPAAPVALPSAAPDNLRVRPAGTDPPDALAADGGACVGDEAIVFLHDGSEAGLGPVSARRARLLGEFDRPDAEATRGLAEAYLAVGFGAEARAVLAVFAPDDPQRPLLDAVARIIDEAGTGTLARMAACDSLIALWAVLDEPAPARGRPVATGAVARAFSSLPAPLRRHLGPRLADRLIALGETGAAHAVRESLGRVGDDGGGALALVEAGLMKAGNDPARAIATLEPAAAGNGPLAGLALARFANAIVDRGDAPDEATLLALAAMAREQAGTAEGRALRQAQARSLAATDAFEAAFALADDAETRREVWALLAERGSDGALLRHAARPPADIALTAPIRARIADRLLDLALPEAALAWIETESAREEERIRAARAAVLARDGRAALRLLAGLDGTEAAFVRGEAATLLGLAEEAEAAFLAAGRADRAAAARWQLRGWDALAGADGGGLPAGARTLIDAARGGGGEPAGPATLAGTRAAIGASREVRAAIGALLESVEPLAAGDRG